MRITSGEFRGRAITAPPGEDVRPTQDRVREALFSMLGECVRGAVFLDLFAGTGAVGLEAVSRGAAKAVFVESAPRSVACISANVERAGAGPRCETHRADALAWLRSCSVTADPFSRLWTSFRAATSDDSFEVYSTFPEYQTVGDMMFPSRIVSTTGGAPVRCTLREVEINPELPDALFELPDQQD